MVCYSEGFKYRSFGNFLDHSCNVNYSGNLYEGYLVGYSSNKDDKRFLVYIENITTGSDGTEFELTGGEAFRGRSEQHIWCDLAKDPMDLLTTQNTLYVQNDYNRLRRYEYITIDKCTHEAIIEKHSTASKNEETDAIRDALYNLFCNKAVRFAVKHSIRQLDLED
jgi:hypothetical protein